MAAVLRSPTPAAGEGRRLTVLIFAEVRGILRTGSSTWDLDKPLKLLILWCLPNKTCSNDKEAFHTNSDVILWINNVHINPELFCLFVYNMFHVDLSCKINFGQR